MRYHILLCVYSWEVPPSEQSTGDGGDSSGGAQKDSDNDADDENQYLVSTVLISGGSSVFNLIFNIICRLRRRQRLASGCTPMEWEL